MIMARALRAEPTKFYCCLFKPARYACVSVCACVCVCVLHFAPRRGRRHRALHAALLALAHEAVLKEKRAAARMRVPPAARDSR